MGAMAKWRGAQLCVLVAILAGACGGGVAAGRVARPAVQTQQETERQCLSWHGIKIEPRGGLSAVA